MSNVAKDFIFLFAFCNNITYSISRRFPVHSTPAQTFLAEFRSDTSFKAVIFCLIKIYHDLPKSLPIFKRRVYFSNVGKYFTNSYCVGIAVLLLGCLWANPVEACVLFVCFLFTGLPYGNTAIPVGKWVEFLRFIFFRVGKSLACHSPGKWRLCA